MGIFDFLKAKPRPTPAERVPALAPLMQACAADPRAMWPSFAASLTGQWDLRIDAIEALVDHYLMKQPPAPRQAMIEGLVASDPASWLIVRASQRVAEAWDVRGGGRKNKNPELFAQLLGMARVDAERVAAAEPRDPSSLSVLIRVGLGTGDTQLAERAYRTATAHAPDCFTCHARFNNVLSQRWGGSHDVQLSHARMVAERAPNGHLAAGLTLSAHFSHVSHLALFDKNPNGAKALAASPVVLGEIRQACARSIDAPNHFTTTGTFDLRTKAAVLGSYAVDADLSRRNVVALGDVYIGDTWNQLSEEPEMWFDGLRGAYGTYR